MPKILKAHNSAVVDLKFSPFHSGLLASSSNDSTIKLWKIPNEGLKKNLTSHVQCLNAHHKKVGAIMFHPTCDNVLASTSFDKTIKFFDISTGDDQISVALPNVPLCIDFNASGSTLVSSCRDKKIRVIDIRAKSNHVVSTIDGHSQTKGFRVLYCKDNDLMVSSGYEKGGFRAIRLYDMKNLKEPLEKITLDQSPGSLMTFYDEDLQILYGAGKGEGIINYYDMTTRSIRKISFYKTNDFKKNQKGMCQTPKLAINTADNEIGRFYKITSNNEIIGMRVIYPRVSTSFSTDLFPPTKSIKPIGNSTDFFSGDMELKPVETISLDPSKRPKDSLFSKQEITIVRKKKEKVTSNKKEVVNYEKMDRKNLLKTIYHLRYKLRNFEDYCENLRKRLRGAALIGEMQARKDGKKIEKVNEHTQQLLIIENEEMKKEIKDLKFKNNLLINESSSKDQIQPYVEKITNLEKTIEDLKLKVEVNDSENMKEDEKDKIINTLMGEKDGLKIKLAKLENELTDKFILEKEELKNQLEDVNNRNEEQKKKLERLSKNDGGNKKLEEELEKLKIRKKEMQQENEELIMVAEELENENNILKAQGDETKELHLQIEEVKSKSEVIIEQLQTQIDTQKEEIENYNDLEIENRGYIRIIKQLRSELKVAKENAGKIVQRNDDSDDDDEEIDKYKGSTVEIEQQELTEEMITNKVFSKSSTKCLIFINCTFDDDLDMFDFCNAGQIEKAVFDLKTMDECYNEGDWRFSFDGFKENGMLLIKGKEGKSLDFLRTLEVVKKNKIKVIIDISKFTGKFSPFIFFSLKSQIKLLRIKKVDVKKSSEKVFKECVEPVEEDENFIEVLEINGKKYSQ